MKGEDTSRSPQKSKGAEYRVRYSAPLVFRHAVFAAVSACILIWKDRSRVELS